VEAAAACDSPQFVAGRQSAAACLVPDVAPNLSVGYRAAESDGGQFGGNSNWRGPIWMPVNFLLIESLQKFHHYYGDDFRIECPTGSGHFVTINDAANELATRLTKIFLTDENGLRPIYGHHPRMQTDPNFRDHVLFYEYFHGDTGRGVGASHQTGWTGLVAKLLMPRYAHPVVDPTETEPMPQPSAIAQRAADQPALDAAGRRRRPRAPHLRSTTR
jgi:hypothetical protein